MGAYLHHDRRCAAIVRMSCVTDFAARTDEAKALADVVAIACAVGTDLDEVLSSITPGGFTVAERVAKACKELGEEIKIESALMDIAYHE